MSRSGISGCEHPGNKYVHYRRAYGSSAINSCMSCSRYVSLAWPITPSVGDHCTPSTAQRHFYRAIPRQAEHTPKSEQQRTDDIANELLIVRHDGAPRSWTTAVYTIRIERIWPASWEMRDWRWRFRATLFRRGRGWLLLLGWMLPLSGCGTVEICGR